MWTGTTDGTIDEQSPEQVVPAERNRGKNNFSLFLYKSSNQGFSFSVSFNAVRKLLVQGAVNSMGTACISAFTADICIEGFANSFGDSGGDAVTIFVAQNTGVVQQKRAKKGFFRIALMMSLCFFVCVTMYLYPSCPPFFWVRAIKPKSIFLLLTHCLLFYRLCFPDAPFTGYFRGIGKVSIPVWGTAVQITIRVIFSYLLLSKFHLSAIAVATGIGWIAACALRIIAYGMLQKRAS